MSKILRGLTEARITSYGPGDPETWPAYSGHPNDPRDPPRRGRQEPDDYDREPYNPMDDYYKKQDAAQAKYNKEVKVEYSDKEGVAPNGERYNSAFVVRASNPYQGDNEIRKFEDLHWGAKKIVDTVKKEPSNEGEPYITAVYYVDNHKYGTWRPWKDEAPTQKPLTFENPVEQFGKVLEGISQEDLANTLCHRIEMRYPDIYKKYDYDAMYNAVDDVASFHAGAEELGSSDINMMIRQVFKRLEESEGLDEGIARGPKEKKLFELLEAWGYFISLKTSKIANDAIDNNASQELRAMQRHYLGPVMNGMSFVDITKSDLWQNPKAIPHLLKYIYQGIPYIEERIKKFVNPASQPSYLSGVEKIKQLYKEVVAQYSQGQQGVTEGSSSKLSSPFEGGKKTTSITPKHKPLVWENMLGTVMAKDPTLKAEPKYFDYKWDDARAYAKVDQCDDLRICKSPGLYQGWPEKGKMALWGIPRQGVAEGYSELDNLKAKFEERVASIIARAKAEGRPLTDREKKAIAILKGEQQGVAEEKGTLWRVIQSEATGRYHVVKGYNKDIKMFKNKMGAGDFNSKEAAQAKADELNGNVSEDQLDELKCWDGYKRVPGTKAGAPGSCEKINELSTDKLSDYKKAAGADARAADKAGDFARGNKRFAGIVKATKKQFDNDTKPKKESAIMKGLVDENLGTPYPGTYEQEFGPFKRKGSERTMKLTTEGKKNVSRRT